MPTESITKSVKVKVEGEIFTQVRCSECSEQLAITSVENGGKHEEDYVYVYVKPHLCPPEVANEQVLTLSDMETKEA